MGIMGKKDFIVHLNWGLGKPKEIILARFLVKQEVPVQKAKHPSFHVSKLQVYNSDSRVEESSPSNMLIFRARCFTFLWTK